MLGDMLTYRNITTLLKWTVKFWYCNITVLSKSSATCWRITATALYRSSVSCCHIALLYRYSKARWHPDTNRNIILLFEGSVRDVVTRLTSRGKIASKDKRSLVHDVQTDIGTHAVFCSVGTCGYLFGGKTGGSWTLATPPQYPLLTCLLGILGNNFTFLLCYSRVAMAMLKHCKVYLIIHTDM